MLQIYSLNLPKQRRGNQQKTKREAELEDILSMFEAAEEKQVAVGPFVSRDMSKVLGPWKLLGSSSGCLTDTALEDLSRQQLLTLRGLDSLQESLAEVITAIKTSPSSRGPLSASLYPPLRTTNNSVPGFCGAVPSAGSTPRATSVYEDADDQSPPEDNTFASVVARPRQQTRKPSNGTGHQRGPVRGAKQSKGRRFLPKDCTNLIIGDSQTRRVIPMLLDTTGKTGIWTRSGATLDSITHEIMDAACEGIPNAESVTEVLVFVGGNDLNIANNCSIELFVAQLKTLIDTLRDVFKQAKVRFCAPLPRKDAPADDFMVSLAIAIEEVYGLGFLIPTGITASNIGADGVHLNDDGLALLCDFFQSVLQIHGGDDTPFWHFGGHRPARYIHRGGNRPNFRGHGAQTREPDEEHHGVTAHQPRHRRRVQILVSNLVTSCTEERVRDYIGDGVLDVLERPTRFRGGPKAFIVTLTEETFRRVYSRDYWKPNVSVRRYYPPRGDL